MFAVFVYLPLLFELTMFAQSCCEPQAHISAALFCEWSDFDVSQLFSGQNGNNRSAGDFVGTMSSPRDRGYNFPGVVRWFAERADVILLFFDPDKPVRSFHCYSAISCTVMF